MGSDTIKEEVKPNFPPPLPGMFPLTPPKHKLEKVKHNFIRPPTIFHRDKLENLQSPVKAIPFNQSPFNNYMQHNENDVHYTTLENLGCPVGSVHRDCNTPLLQSMDDFLLPPEGNVYHTLQPVYQTVFDLPSTSEPKIYQQLQPVVQNRLDNSFVPKSYHVTTLGTHSHNANAKTHQELKSGPNLSKISPNQLCNVTYHPPNQTHSRLYQQLRQPLNNTVRTNYQPGGNSCVPNNLGPVNLNNFEGTSCPPTNQCCKQNQSTKPHLITQLTFRPDSMALSPLNSKMSFQSKEASNSPGRGFQTDKPKVYLELRNPSVNHQVQAIPSNYVQNSNSPGNLYEGSQKEFHYIKDTLKTDLSAGPFELNELRTNSKSYKLPKNLNNQECTTSDMVLQNNLNMTAKSSIEFLPFKYTSTNIAIASMKHTKTLLSLPKAPVCYGDSVDSKQTHSNNMESQGETNRIVGSNTGICISDSKLHKLLTSPKSQQTRNDTVQKCTVDSFTATNQSSSSVQNESDCRESTNKYRGVRSLIMKETEINVNNGAFNDKTSSLALYDVDYLNKDSKIGEQSDNRKNMGRYELGKLNSVTSNIDISNKRMSGHSFKIQRNVSQHSESLDKVGSNADIYSKYNNMIHHSVSVVKGMMKDCNYETQDPSESIKGSRGTQNTSSLNHTTEPKIIKDSLTENYNVDSKCLSEYSSNNMPKLPSLSNPSEDAYNRYRLNNSEITDSLLKILSEKTKSISQSVICNNMNTTEAVKSPDKNLETVNLRKQTNLITVGEKNINVRSIKNHPISTEKSDPDSTDESNLETNATFVKSYDPFQDSNHKSNSIIHTTDVLNNCPQESESTKPSLKMSENILSTDNLVEKNKKKRYVTHKLKSTDSHKLCTGDNVGNNLDDLRKPCRGRTSAKENISSIVCFGEVVLGKRCVKKVDYKLLNGGDDEDEGEQFLVKKRTYKRKKKTNYEKIKNTDNARVTIIANSIFTHNIDKPMSDINVEEAEKQKKRKYRKRAKTNLETDLDGQMYRRKTEKVVKLIPKKPEWELGHDDIDPLEAGLISDSDDEVVFVGFDLPAEEEETELGMTSSSSATSLLAQLNADVVTVDCDPYPVIPTSSVPCPLCTKTFSCHQQLVNHIQHHSKVEPSELHSIVCCRGFSSNNKLVKHVEWNHKGGKRFTCNVCTKNFTTKAYIKKHLETIHKTELNIKEEPNMIFFCAEGIKSFPSEKLLEKHADKIHSKNLHQCNKCLKYFEKVSSLNTHKITHSTNPMVCSKCGEQFTSNQYLQSHCRDVHRTKVYKCDTCHREFTASNTLNRHKLLHSKNKPYHCEICKRSFNLLSTLKTHLLIHTGVRRFECRLCHKTFNRRDVLNSHQWTHTGEKRFQCDICKERFRWRHAVKSHKLVHHSTEKPFMCKVCGKKFSHPASHKKHAEVHAEKLYYCEICLKAFSRLNTLKNHVITHTDHKPFICDICNRGFRSKGHLRGHFLVHTKEKPWLCKYCNKTYKDCNRLRRHKRIVHGKVFYKKVPVVIQQNCKSEENLKICQEADPPPSGNHNVVSKVEDTDGNEIILSSE